jgi:hypothetical protein
MQGDEVSTAIELGRALTGDVAPEELPFYDEMVAAELQPKAKKKDHTLAFGLDPAGIGIGAIVFEVSTVIVSAMWTAFQPMLAGVAQDVSAGMRKTLSDRLNQWIATKFAGPPPVKLTAKDIKQISQIVKTRGKANGCSQEQISRIESAVMRVLHV